MEKVYPKIVIIGNSINLREGGGITLFNLLKGWSKDKISIVANKIDEDGLEICSSYYRIGYDETKRPWPLNRFQPFYESTPVILESTHKSGDTLNEYSEKKSKYNGKLKSFFESVLHFFGIYYYLFPFRLSSKFMKWLEKEAPQVIYTQLTSPDTIFFMKELMQKVNIPLYIHIMDDWPRIINKSGFSHLYWNRKIHSDFKWLMNKAAGLLSICETMSEEYKERYNHNFTAFHNCIDVDHWGEHQKTNYDIANNKFVILYAGRIGLGTYHSILTFAEAVEKIQMKNIEVEFQIQPGNLPDFHKNQLLKFTKTKIVDFVEYTDLPQKLSSADLLLLPMDFDGKNLKFIHLSMPTKVPEYMSTGVPIFVFAHKSTALYQYANNEGWAFTFAENNANKLSHTVCQIINDKEKRIAISRKAKAIAFKNHEGNKVREEFRQFFLTNQKSASGTINLESL